jgi:phosphate uptake regulator
MKTVSNFHGRRIQKTGGATYIVSLPKSWVVERGLRAGDVLQFTPHSDGSLSVYAEAGSAAPAPPRVVEISNDTPHEHIIRLLVAEYIAGAPLLQVRTRGRMDATTREVIRSFTQRMIGPEILEETADAVILQDVVGPNPLPIPSVVRRMYQMVRAMQSDAMAAFRARDASIARDVIDRDWEVDRLHWFLTKQVTTALRDIRTLAALELTLPECASFLLASRVLERIADHAVRIAGTVAMLDGETLPSTLVTELDRLAAGSAQVLDEAVESFSQKDVARANKVLDKAAALSVDRERILHAIGAKRGRLAVALAYVLESLERSAMYAGDLAEIAMNRAVEGDGVAVHAEKPLKHAAPAA